MPRALGGRFEPLDHFVLSHLCDPWASLALRSPHAANRFSGLAIGVRTRSCALRSHSCFIHRSECSRLSSWFPWFLAFCSARWCRGLCCGSWAEILYLIDLFIFILVPQIGECCHGGLLGRSTRYNTRWLQV